MVSGRRVTPVGHGPVPVHALDMAVAIVAVAEVLAPAEAGDVVGGLAVLEGVPVWLQNLGTARPRELRKLAVGQGLEIWSPGRRAGRGSPAPRTPRGSSATRRRQPRHRSKVRRAFPVGSCFGCAGPPCSSSFHSPVPPRPLELVSIDLSLRVPFAQDGWARPVRCLAPDGRSVSSGRASLLQIPRC